MFPHSSGIHLPAESVYAVFEVKPTFSETGSADSASTVLYAEDLKRSSRPSRAPGETPRSSTCRQEPPVATPNRNRPHFYATARSDTFGSVC
jgi:hypothetical protein